ncbi:MAG: YggU family protein [Acidobacteria bacterium]|nr:MAG: YggU family protein [Acidobacteriota bacterium]
MGKTSKQVDEHNHRIITVHVVPRASRSEVVGEHNGGLRVRIAAPPVDGAANEELIRLLAKTFAVSKSDISVLSGRTGRIKQVRIDNLKS